MIKTFSFEDSKSLDDIKYIEKIIKEDRDEYPIDEYFQIIKDNPVYQNWNTLTKNIPVKLGYRNECDKGASINAELNLWIKKSLGKGDNIGITLSKLMKFFSLIQIKYKCLYSENGWIRDLIYKKITPKDYATNIFKIEYQSLVISLYLSLLYVSLTNQSYDMLISEILPLTHLKLYDKSLKSVLSLLRNILEDKQIFADTFEIFLNEERDSKNYRELLQNGKDIYFS